MNQVKKWIDIKRKAIIVTEGTFCNAVLAIHATFWNLAGSNPECMRRLLAEDGSERILLVFPELSWDPRFEIWLKKVLEPMVNVLVIIGSKYMPEELRRIFGLVVNRQILENGQIVSTIQIQTPPPEFIHSILQDKK